MRKNLFISAAIALSSVLSAQVLWQDDFESYGLGNFTEQNGWELDLVQPGWVQILELDADKGKSIQLHSTMDNDSGMFVYRKNNWEDRDPGKNIVSLSLDFFTGKPTEGIGLVVLTTENHRIAIEVGWDQEFNTLYVTGGNDMVINLLKEPKLDTWYHIEALYNTETGEVKTRLNNGETLTGMTLPNITPYYLQYASLFASNIGIDNVVVAATDVFELGLNDFQKTATQSVIYPNPVNDVLNIQTNRSINHLTLIDLNGKVIQKAQAEKSLNVNNLTPGTYFLSIKYQDGGTENKKFIKK